MQGWAHLVGSFCLWLHHPCPTSVHCFPVTFSDYIGAGRTLKVSVALSEQIWIFSRRLCNGTRPQRAVKSYKKLTIRLRMVLHAWRRATRRLAVKA